MISQRAWMVGAVGFCFYLIVIVNTLPSFYYALTWLAAGVLVSSLGIALLSLVGLRCAWRAPHAVVARTSNDESTATSALVEVQMANAGTLNKTGIVLEVKLERCHSTLPAPRSQRFLLEALPSGQSLSTQLPLTHLDRGRYRVLEVCLVGSDVLGLFHIRKRVPPGLQFDATSNAIPASEDRSTHEIIVGPAIVPCAERIVITPASVRGTGGAPATRLRGYGDELRGTRLYAPGDDLRHVHWQSTARRGQLVVKEFHHQLQTRAQVVWDGAADTIYGEADHANTAQEWGLRLVASLCHALEERGQIYSLSRLDAKPQILDCSHAQTFDRIAAGVSPQAAQVAELLADAQANRTTALSEAFATASARENHGHRFARQEFGTLYVVSASLSAGLPHAALQWRRSGGEICIALLDAAALAQKADDQSSALFRAQRDHLQRTGAHVVTVAPHEGHSATQVLGTALGSLLQLGATQPRAQTTDKELVS